MNARTGHRIVIAVVATLLISASATRLSAQDGCTAASLQGSYAFSVDGTNVSNGSLPVGAFAAVGKNTYDGKGNMQGVIVVSANGAIIPATYTGTYTVNSDCTGSKSAALNIGLTVDFDFVIHSNLRGIEMIVTKAGPAGKQLACAPAYRQAARYDLMEAVWGYRNPTASNVVDVVVRSLRRKLGVEAGVVETVRGTGYRYRMRAQTP